MQLCASTTKTQNVNLSPPLQKKSGGVEKGVLSNYTEIDEAVEM